MHAVYLALQNAHDPNQAAPRFEALYPHVDFAPRQTYLAMAAAIDEVRLRFPYRLAFPLCTVEGIWQ